MSSDTLKAIYYPAGGDNVEKTAATTLARLHNLNAPLAYDRKEAEQIDGVRVCLAANLESLLPATDAIKGHWIFLQINSEGAGLITASYPSLLFAAVHLLVDGLNPEQRRSLSEGLLLPAGFTWNRPLYDTTLTQIARTVRDFDQESYIAHLARCGFTHLEVNGLAFHTAHEPGVPGEFYSQFYSYGPGLMQFVDTKLTRGLYEVSYLQANLNRLRRLVGLGRKYGLKPGLLSYEPRTLPEVFFHKYPTLRGARVDHPFRSRMPRYTLAQDHPVAREHYQELMYNLMKEAPDLAYLSVWTNDSGSGFEHTSSLYSGRNGGPYLIREWRNHDKIAKAAGESATRWLRLMQESAAVINPAFEVSLRIEPFKVEHDTIIDGLGNGLTIEAPSLLVHGYHLPYQHMLLPENDGIAGTMFHTEMHEDEVEKLAYYRSKDMEPIVQYAPGSTFNMEPLLGVPYPRMLYKKLQSLKQVDITRVSAIGGLLHPDKTPYWPNSEIIRCFQLNTSLPLETVLHNTAASFVGDDLASTLISAWDKIEEALSYMPYLPLFSNFGFVWYRLWVRPFVPNIEAIPKEERAYYERFMVTMANNSNMNDLGKDVLFQLVDATSGAYMARAFDEHVLPKMEKAFQFVTEVTARLQESKVNNNAIAVFQDLLIRLRAARCWARTQRNLCTWVVNVYGYLDSSDTIERAQYVEQLQQMIDDDLKNTNELMDLWANSPTEFMLVSEIGETSYIYGENFGKHLQRKLALTDAYRHHDPFIDKDIIWRIE